MCGTKLPPNLKRGINTIFNHFRNTHARWIGGWLMSVISGIDIIKRTVVYIFSGEVDGEHLTSVGPLGTGFFVAVPLHQVEGRI
jgi:hypothetical protein